MYSLRAGILNQNTVFNRGPGRGEGRTTTRPNPTYRPCRQHREQRADLVARLALEVILVVALVGVGVGVPLVLALAL